MNSKALFGPLLVCALFWALGSSTPIAAGGGDEQVSTPQDRPIPPGCPVSNVVAAFGNIPPRGGQPVQFLWGPFGKPDFGSPFPCKHFQGIASMEAHNGTQYFFLTRSGNKTASCDDPDDPGELWVFRDDDPPTACHRIVFDGSPGRPGWMHPGGVQLIDGVLVVPVEKKWPEGGGGAILLFDVQDPEEPEFLKQIEQFGTTVLKPPGVVAVTKMPDGKYLFAVTGGDYDGTDTVWFGLSASTDLRHPDLAIDFYDDWKHAELGPDKDKWSCGRSSVFCGDFGFQTLNFIRDTNGALYIAGTDNDTSPIDSGEDWARLFRVYPGPGNTTLAYAAERHLYVGDPENMGDLDAAGGFYVTPSGHLILYTCDHNGDDTRALGGRFESTYYNDAIPPVTTHTLAGILGEHGWYVSPVQVTLNASDTCGSGAELTQYSIDSGAWQTYTGPFVYSAGGSHDVRYRSQDTAGNWESEKTVSFRIDTVTPTGSIGLNHDASRTHSALVQVNPSASDAHSGVWQMRLRDAGGSWAAWQGYTGSAVLWQLPATTGRSYSVEAQFKDWAGNVSQVYTDDIYLDIYPSRPRSSGYLLAASTWGACGTGDSSANYLRQGTLGQPSMIGQLSSANYAVSSGYWAVQGKGMGVGFIYLPLVLRNR